MTRPSASIIIPCFNAAPWLAATLESALAQTWQKKEVICVDDGSSDCSLAIARLFEVRGVRVLSQPNRGASSARNRGLTEATGDFVQFLDADDLLHPYKIEAQLALLQTLEPGFIASARWGRFETDPCATRFFDTPVFRDLAPLEFLRLAAEEGHMMHPAAWLTPRGVLNAAGPWDESLSLNDDGEYFARVVLASRGIAFCPAAETFYRSQIKGSLSGRNDERAKDSILRSVDLIASHMLNAEDSAGVRAAIAVLYLRVLHTIYPASRSLVKRTEAKVGEFGGVITAPPMGPRAAAIARVIGWKMTWRLISLRDRQSGN